MKTDAGALWAAIRLYIESVTEYIIEAKESQRADMKSSYLDVAASKLTKQEAEHLDRERAT